MKFRENPEFKLAALDSGLKMITPVCRKFGENSWTRTVHIGNIYKYIYI